MPNQTSRKSRWAYINEVTPGTTPAEALQILRVQGGSEGINPSIEEDTELDEIEPTDLIRNDFDAKITLNGRPSYGAIDDFLACVFCNNWEDNVLVVSDLLKTMTVERQLLTAGVYIPYKFCLVESVQIAFQQGSSPTFSVGLVSARPPVAAGSSSVGTDSPTAAPSTRKMTTRSIQVAQEGGSGSLLAGAPGVTAVTFDFTRNIIKGPQLGTHNWAHADPEQFTGKISFSTYIGNKNLLDKWLGDIQTPLSFTIGGATYEKYNFLVSRGGFASGGLGDGQKGSSYVQSYQITGLTDPTNTSVKVTRTPPEE